MKLISVKECLKLKTLEKIMGISVHLHLFYNF